MRLPCIDDDNNEPGAFPGRMMLESATIRDEAATAVHLSRLGGNTDSYLIGLKQTLAYGELDEFDSVILTADVKIASHSLPAGGEQGSEYPMILLLRYRDGMYSALRSGLFDSLGDARACVV